MRQAIRCLSFLFTAALLAGSVSPAFAQSTALTYQGSLDDAGAPASGLHDFRVLLFNAASGGVVVGLPQCADNVDVIGGVFTLQLDFGQAYATTAERHLQIQVRRDTGLTCGDVTGFVTLSPRQQLTATPMASHAKSAFALDAAGGPPNALFVDNSGNVGIGTTSPAALVHLRGTAPVMVLQDNASASDQAGYVTFWNNASTETGWLGYGTIGSPQLSLVNARTNGDLRLYTGSGGDINFTPGSGGDVNLVGGNVGIGTFTPTAKLDVRGDIKLGPAAEFQATCSGEKLRIICGTVFSDGSPDGAGYTSSRTATGVYSITFDQSFSFDVPAVTVTPEWILGIPLIPMVSVNAGPTVTVRIFKLDGTPANNTFNFTAIGRR